MAENRETFSASAHVSCVEQCSSVFFCHGIVLVEKTLPCCPTLYTVRHKRYLLPQRDRFQRIKNFLYQHSYRLRFAAQQRFFCHKNVFTENKDICFLSSSPVVKCAAALFSSKQSFPQKEKLSLQASLPLRRTAQQPSPLCRRRFPSGAFYL